MRFSDKVKVSAGRVLEGRKDDIVAKNASDPTSVRLRLYSPGRSDRSVRVGRRHRSALAHTDLLVQEQLHTHTDSLWCQRQSNND